MFSGVQLQSHFNVHSALHLRAGEHPSSHGRGHGASEAASRNAGHASPASIFYSSRSEYSSSVTYSRPAAETQAASEPEERATRASNTILSFIEAQLLRDLDDGATTEELASRLQAGLEGFERGFTEAMQMLEGMEGMSEAIYKELHQTRELVLAGTEALSQRFVEGENPEQTTDGTTVAPAEESPAADTPVTENLSVSSVYAAHSAAQRHSFSFSLTTAEGDRVQINASSLRASIIESFVSAQGELEAMGQQGQRDRFDLKIKGELDAEELRAINELLGKVADLADQFFAGDIEQAYTAAMELGYDNSEISQFALRLKHTSVQRMTQAYDYDGDVAAGLAEKLHPLSDYVAQLLDAYETASRFQQPLQLLQDLAPSFSYYESSHFAESMRLAVRA